MVQFLSDRFRNRYILNYKIGIGIVILIMTSSCQSPKKDAGDNQLMTSAMSIDSTLKKEEPEPPVESPEVFAAYDDIEPDTIPQDTNHIYEIVEILPEFTGGRKALIEYLDRNLKYPSILADSYIQGRVIVQFVVEKDGSITSPKVLRSVHELLDQEALRLVRQMPKWQPGQHHGVPVRAYYTIPVRFVLE